ncbi:hypothetical protein RhiirC2_140030 [Rhizophagus irregularis]|uniref:Uncharacterized protein n=1 Tax=Rhizophagus irregularis TaxID=588596 RepID=A0A2N1MP64_9GLOM|nr:hypothetical protein RhiirC2_140030 [Rhizophagus irregularis]
MILNYGRLISLLAISQNLSNSIFNNLPKEEHINIIVKPPAHIPKLDHAEATEDVKCPHCQATFKSKNRNYKKHKSTCKPNGFLQYRTRTYRNQNPYVES